MFLAGGASVKISRCFAILAFVGAILVFVGLSSSTALADSLPPDPGVRRCCDVFNGTGLFTPNDPNFNFTVFGGNGSGPNGTNGLFASFNFINATGRVATGLDLAINSTTAPGLIFTCQNNDTPAGFPYFTSCAVIQTGDTALIEFRGPGGTYNGIPTATDLTNVSQCSDGPHFCSTQTPGAGFVVQVFDHNNDLISLSSTKFFTGQGFLLVPEPSTVLLVLVGVVFLFLFRRAGWVPKLT
jgi:hypothetical protein